MTQCKECPWALPVGSTKRRGLVTGCMTFWEKFNFTINHPKGHACHSIENAKPQGSLETSKCGGHLKYLQSLQLRFSVVEGAD